MSLTLVIGGVRSGKSARAETLATASGRPVRYVATADPADTSMAERIAAHAARRPRSWTTVEADATLGGALGAGDGECVLVDGLGLWLARSLEASGAFADDRAADGARGTVSAEIDALIAAATERPVIVVAEEAGLGTLPPGRGARLWLDVLGEAVQRLAAVAEHVEFVVAGRPIALVGGAPASDARATPRDPAGSLGNASDGLREHGDRLVRPGDADHAVNVLAGGPPPWLREELERALAAEAGTYPDETDAVAALAALHGREAGEIVPTNGAAQALWLLPAALRPALAACIHPGFTEGEAALRAHGVPVVRVVRDPERGFALDLAAVPEAADLVLVGNPASPSGTLGPAAGLVALRRPGRTVVVDEAFMDLVPGEPASLVREPLADVIVVRSLTKSLSIPGLRAGYAVAARPLADRLRAVRPPWSVNALALAALAAAAARPDALAAAAERTTREREDLVGRLARVPRLRSWPSSANFCLVQVPDGPRVLRMLRAAGIAVRPAASFPCLGPSHLRLTARGPEENARLAEALAEAVMACP
jgi:histidinol-phosphate/aromatic aminotransferase/cobyric acid decarboxylase-like protein/adenosyl cobinamide kinase/adenosyl cobinamide phosphate guanylyltransferase